MKNPRSRHPVIGDEHLWVAGYLCSIVLAVGFVVAGVPWLLRASGSWQLGLPLLLLTAPLIATGTRFLQESSARRGGWAGFLRAYAGDLIDLGARILTILAILPWIGLQLLLVIGGILSIALLAMLLLGAIQHAFGVHMAGITDFSGADLSTAALWLAGVLGGMLLAGLAMRGLQSLAPLALTIAERARRAIARRIGNDST